MKHDFSLPLYTEFRRLAIDDLSSRHVDNGFHALMDYYRWALYSDRRLETPVIEDIIHLSQKLKNDYDATIYETLQRALWSGEMEWRNYDRAFAAFSAVFGSENWDMSTGSVENAGW